MKLLCWMKSSEKIQTKRKGPDSAVTKSEPMGKTRDTNIQPHYSTGFPKKQDKTAKRQNGEKMKIAVFALPRNGFKIMAQCEP